jgi:hypothetical protein
MLEMKPVINANSEQLATTKNALLAEYVFIWFPFHEITLQQDRVIKPSL